jgi:hypothetical protein
MRIFGGVLDAYQFANLCINVSTASRGLWLAAHAACATVIS